MRRARMMMWFCIVGLFALSAGMTPSASAAEKPEFFRCLERAGDLWTYTEDKCATVSPTMEGKFEKVPLGAAEKVAFTGKSKGTFEPKLKTTVLEIKCKKSKSTGEVLGSTEIKKVVVTYEECKGPLNIECETVETMKGIIKTEELEGRIGYTLPLGKKLVGVELEAVNKTTKVISKFKCAGTEAETTGCLIGEALPINKLQTTGELEYKENAGKNGQEFTEIEGGKNKPCKAQVTFGSEKATAWLVTEEELTFNMELQITA